MRRGEGSARDRSSFCREKMQAERGHGREGGRSGEREVEREIRGKEGEQWR